MARIRVIIEDDNGQPLDPSSEQVYSLEGPCRRLSEIEASVECFKRQALPQITASLLSASEEQEVALLKKRSGVSATDTAI